MLRLRPYRSEIQSLVLLFLAVGSGLQSARAEAFKLEVGSSRADTVSGGEALVRLSAPNNSKWTALLNGDNVTRLFRPVNEGSGDDPLALLTGLKTGKNRLEIRVDGVVKAELEITNHPLTGPIFSGPHQQPFICQTTESGLGAALDADCSAQTVVRYYYRSTEPVKSNMSVDAPPSGEPWPGFKWYPSSGPAPADVAQTVTTEGHKVPYIVRREIGTINRGVYDIQFLHQPGQPLPNPWSGAVAGWNRRLVYLIGGGWSAGYHQGKLEKNVGPSEEPYLSQGYAVATSTLNVFGITSNDKLAAETLSMVKEHFIKSFGEPVHTIGSGGSGGAMEQHLIVQNYPGLLDGILPYLSFPDMITTTQSATDCGLFNRAFRNSKQMWTDPQKAAVAGFSSYPTCEGWGAEADKDEPPISTLDSKGFCDSSIPKEQIYERTSNPTGTRCEIFVGEVNYLGRDPKTGFVRRPVDSTGVQYGLVAFNSGKISAEQFVELNERMGGYDQDGHIVRTRTEADPEAVRLAFQTGTMLTGGGGLNQVPIIDWEPYADDASNQHDHVRAYITRARLIAAQGSARNQVILTYPRYTIGDMVVFMKAWNFEAVWPKRMGSLVREIDRWLDNIAADSGSGTAAEKVARNKPPDLADGCWTTDGEKVTEPASFSNSGRCNGMYPPHGDPRIAAGGPLTDDILKCTLKPLDPSSYANPLSADQLARLKAVFPSGVCDYSRPGAGYAVTTTTWRFY